MKRKSTKNIVPLGRKAGLYLKNTRHKGRGVFCVTRIEPGEILEVTPALLLNEKETDFADNTILLNYTFQTGPLSKSLRRQAKLGRGDGTSIVMGIASFCNHSQTPNAEVQWLEKGGTLYYQLVATKKIPKHTEICTSYGDNWFRERRKKF